MRVAILSVLLFVFVGSVAAVGVQACNFDGATELSVVSFVGTGPLAEVVVPVDEAQIAVLGLLQGIAIEHCEVEVWCVPPDIVWTYNIIVRTDTADRHVDISYAQSTPDVAYVWAYNDLSYYEYVPTGNLHSGGLCAAVMLPIEVAEPLLH